jgi:hypothetical protein
MINYCQFYKPYEQTNYCITGNAKYAETILIVYQTLYNYAKLLSDLTFQKKDMGK